MVARRVTLFVVGLMLCCSTAFTQVPSDEEIRKILADRVGSENLGIGMVVGVIDANGRRVVAYGSLAKRDTRRLDGDTVFEIGSMTKVFTSLLLMDMTRRGEVALTDPVSKYLPQGVKAPERNGRKITLADLSTESSGLPRMPARFTPKDAANPYADFSVQQMYDFLSRYLLTRDVGSRYDESDLGAGLLGHALSLRANMSFEALVRARICDPLGMANTRVTLTPEMKARLAVGHDATVTGVANWDFPALAGAGGLRSTANDLLTFLAASLGYVKTPLAQAMADQISIRRPAGVGDMEIFYGWHIHTRGGDSTIWRNGSTGGYRTFMGYDPKAHAGVVVLSNISTAIGLDDIGRHLLHASDPLLEADLPKAQKEITLDTKIFDRYVGIYQLGPYGLLSISREGDRFYAQITGQPRVEMFAESDRKFFLKVVDAQLTFDVDEQGVPTQAILHQHGIDNTAKRLKEAEVKRAVDVAEARNAELERRFKEQIQSPETEATVRRWIRELQLGQPNYDRMTAILAEGSRRELSQLKTRITGFGELRSVSFQSVGPGGFDIYEVRFENATTQWMVILTPDGKTQAITFR